MRLKVILLILIMTLCVSHLWAIKREEVLTNAQNEACYTYCSANDSINWNLNVYHPSYLAGSCPDESSPLHRALGYPEDAFQWEMLTFLIWDILAIHGNYVMGIADTYISVILQETVAAISQIMEFLEITGYIITANTGGC